MLAHIHYKVLEGRSVTSAGDLADQLTELSKGGWCLVTTDLRGDYVLCKTVLFKFSRDHIAPAPRNRRPPFSPFGNLTPRQEDALALLCQGMSNRQIASSLGIHLQSAKNHVSNIIQKANVANRTELVALLIRAGKL
jgi:DNA-binding NarL/FixJ family response regulator